ncbi:MAG: hypothetical protein U1F68_02510 [Gammaproteobacteria bacterium]
MRRQLLKRSEWEAKAFGQLARKTFACAADASQALWEFERRLQVLFISEAKVQPTPRARRWQVCGHPASNPDVRWRWLRRRATFILATNELDTQRLPDAAVLEQYKQQQQAERGFRLRTALSPHAVSEVPQRIMALLMIMTVFSCLCGVGVSPAPALGDR